SRSAPPRRSLPPGGARTGGTCATMYEVVLSAKARAFFASASGPLARKLARCFAQLERDPRSGNNVKRLTGRLAGHLRYRVGDWRVVYRIDNTARRVLVATIAHRSDAYQ